MVDFKAWRLLITRTITIDIKNLQSSVNGKLQPFLPFTSLTTFIPLKSNWLIHQRKDVIFDEFKGYCFPIQEDRFLNL
jgi:hypothetical protein